MWVRFFTLSPVPAPSVFSLLNDLSWFLLVDPKRPGATMLREKALPSKYRECRLPWVRVVRHMAFNTSVLDEAEFWFLIPDLHLNSVMVLGQLYVHLWELRG